MYIHTVFAFLPTLSMIVIIIINFVLTKLNLSGDLKKL